LKAYYVPYSAISVTSYYLALYAEGGQSLIPILLPAEYNDGVRILATAGGGLIWTIRSVRHD
jgi:hypothetical protein